MNNDQNVTVDQNKKMVEEGDRTQIKAEIKHEGLDLDLARERGTIRDKLTDSSKVSTGQSLNTKDFQSPSQISIITTHDAASPSRDQSAVSPRRKQRPHPGPIIIPASVNNKVTHSVTFSSSTVKPASPVKMGYHNPPIYTPPPMLSPRSIFFTGTTCGTPRSAIPLTPGRLLLSARRPSATMEATKEEESEPMAIPEP